MPPELDVIPAPSAAGPATPAHPQSREALQQRIAQLEAQLQRACAALDSLRQGLVVVDSSARIAHVNAAALSAVSAGLCRIEQGQLGFGPGAEQLRFTQLLAGACAAPGVARGGALLLRNALATLTVSVVPLRAGHPLAQARGELALVVLVDPAAQDDDDPRVLAELLSLSRSETRLALMLAAGQTVQEFAAVQQCSLHTARTHLRNLMQKSGCHRQVEVVQLVQSLRLA